MEGLVRGDVVVLEYPFSDLSQTKRRPALVVALLPHDDVLLCQITTRPRSDRSAIALTERDFAAGKLSKPSYVRPGRMFAVDRTLALYRAGRVSSALLARVAEAIVEIVRGNSVTSD